MLGNRSQMRIPDSLKNRGMGMGNIRRRHGSLSSLPSSSISGRPIRDRRRNDDRRKVKDVKVCSFFYVYFDLSAPSMSMDGAHSQFEIKISNV